MLCSCSPGCTLSSVFICVYLIHTPFSCPGCWRRPLTICWALGLHGLVDHIASACFVFLTNISVPSLCCHCLSDSLCCLNLLSFLTAWAFTAYSPHTSISVSKTVKHFRIFWSSSVLGWWHGTSVASLSNLCPQRACSKWFRPLLQNDSHAPSHTLLRFTKTG